MCVCVHTVHIHDKNVSNDHSEAVIQTVQGGWLDGRTDGRTAGREGGWWCLVHGSWFTVQGGTFLSNREEERGDRRVEFVGARPNGWLGGLVERGWKLYCAR